jgi:hypothetical protein
VRPGKQLDTYWLSGYIKNYIEPIREQETEILEDELNKTCHSRENGNPVQITFSSFLASLLGMGIWAEERGQEECAVGRARKSS